MQRTGAIMRHHEIVRVARVFPVLDHNALVAGNVTATDAANQFSTAMRLFSHTVN